MPELSNFEKATGYIQILKLEGMLDAEAIQVTKEMYELTDEEAKAALEKFKEDNPAAYTASGISNIWHMAGGLLYCVLVAVTYFIFGDEMGGTFGSAAGIFAAVFAILGFMIIARMLTVAGEYLMVRFPRLRHNAFANNKAAPAFIAAIVFVVFAWINYTYRLDALSLNDLHPFQIVLETDCFEKEYRGKTTSWGYIFKASGIQKPFEWHSADHKYSFNTAAPDRLIKAGDSISVFMLRSDMPRIERDPTIFNSKTTGIYDIEKAGVRFLDLEKRNSKANESSLRLLKVCVAALLIIGIVAMILHLTLNRNVH